MNVETTYEVRSGSGHVAYTDSETIARMLADAVVTAPEGGGRVERVALVWRLDSSDCVYRTYFH